MARRGAAIAQVLTTAGVLVAAIVLLALALATWDIGTRGPRELLADVRAARHDGRALLRGLMRFTAGMLLVLGGTLIVILDVPGSLDDFVPVEALAVVAALGVELLIGPELRRLLPLK